MQGLGRTENVDPVAYANKAAPRKSVRSKEGAGKRAGPKKAKSARERQPAENITGDAWVDALPRTWAKSFAECIRELLAQLESAERTAGISDKHPTATDGHSAATNARIDLNFGVEQLSYKNMWKVLKTVVREIGDIKEASTGRFFLGVSERVDKATTLMEFSSMAGYMEKKAAKVLDDTLSNLADGSAERIMSDPATSLDAQANTAPETVLHLLTG